MPDAAAAVAVGARESFITQGPVLRVLASLALPNVFAMIAAALVGVAETAYVGALGLEPLAAMALVFPFVMLMQNLSGGAMGGGIAAAVSRALGRGDMVAARLLAWNALAIAIVSGLVFGVLFVGWGAALYRLLGARDRVLHEALAYSTVVFAGAPIVWLANAFISIQRGTGDMRLPAQTLLATAATQVAVGATLGLGLGPFPRWGMAGVGLGQVVAYAGVAVFMGSYLASPGRRLQLVRFDLKLDAAYAKQILRVGLPACLSPVQTISTVLVLTALVAPLGVDVLAGYGIGARLEFLMIPIAFGIGVATVPMVGMSLGRGDLARARRVAWTAAGVSAATIGAIGTIACVVPMWWAGWFTTQTGVLDHACSYLRHAGPGYLFFGLGLTLFFASQGAGRVMGPVLAGTLRLAIVCVGGYVLQLLHASADAYFTLVAVAMVAYGLGSAWSVKRVRWNA